jgi:hypothetical protein
MIGNRAMVTTTTRTATGTRMEGLPLMMHSWTQHRCELAGYGWCYRHAGGGRDVYKHRHEKLKTERCSKRLRSDVK